MLRVVDGLGDALVEPPPEQATGTTTVDLEPSAVGLEAVGVEQALTVGPEPLGNATGAVVLPGFDFDMPSGIWSHLDEALAAEDHPQFRFVTFHAERVAGARGDLRSGGASRSPSSSGAVLTFAVFLVADSRIVQQ